MPEESMIPKLEGLPLPEFLGLMDEKPHYMGPAPVVRWENFIAPMLKLRPKLQRAIFRVDQEPATSWTQTELGKDKRSDPWPNQTFWNSLDTDQLNGRVLLDLDIDYYFGRVAGDLTQTASDEFIAKGLRWLRPQLPHDTIVTIALSPDCCGSRAAAIRVCELACQAMRITPPPFDELYPAAV